jgi:hypothetical protein
VDISDTLAPKSDQLDAVDLLSGPRVFTVAGVARGSAEQPVEIALAEFPRPWRPGKSMRRVLVSTWGPDASLYVGRRLTLFCDETVRFGGAAVGGVRISHMSGIDKPKATPLIISKGKSAMYTVEPLPDAAPAPTADDIATETDRDVLKAMWKAHPHLHTEIRARVAELDGAS